MLSLGPLAVNLTRAQAPRAAAVRRSITTFSVTFGERRRYLRVSGAYAGGSDGRIRQEPSAAAAAFYDLTN